MSEWIPIFRTGTHTDMAGNLREWTEHDLDTIVEKYNPAEHSAPEVIGHPEHNSPAWGWVEGLKREGQLLYMKAKDRAPEFVEMLKKGLFRKRSISLYPDLTLRHVGWLGATPPAVKGLPDVAFGKSEKGVMEFALCCDGCRRDARPCVSTINTDTFSEKEGDMPGEKDEAQAKIELEVEKRLKAERKKIEVEFAEAEKQKKQTAEFAEVQAKREREIAEREKVIAEKEKSLKREEIKAFCEGLQKEGKLTPAMVKHGLVGFMETLSDLKSEPISFAEGGAKQTPYEYAKSFLSGFGKQIEFSEVATRDKDVKAGDIEKKRKAAVQSYMEAHKDVKYRDAVLAVSGDNPELFERN